MRRLNESIRLDTEYLQAQKPVSLLSRMGGATVSSCTLSVAVHRYVPSGTDNLEGPSFTIRRSRGVSQLKLDCPCKSTGFKNPLDPPLQRGKVIDRKVEIIFEFVLCFGFRI